jgi:hypothetical protein
MNGKRASNKNFVLQKVQPALLGLKDGAVSTLAPIFAAAGLTGKTESAFFVGLAASLGAGVSMGLAEALSDDGSVTGRGGPILRGAITGIATAIGGMLHTFPFLISNFERCSQRSLCRCRRRIDCNRLYPLPLHERKSLDHDRPSDSGRRNCIWHWHLAGSDRR